MKAAQQRQQQAAAAAEGLEGAQPAALQNFTTVGPAAPSTEAPAAAAAQARALSTPAAACGTEPTRALASPAHAAAADFAADEGGMEQEDEEEVVRCGVG